MRDLKKQDNDKFSQLLNELYWEDLKDPDTNIYWLKQKKCNVEICEEI